MPRKRLLRNAIVMLTIVLLVGLVASWIVAGKLVASANCELSAPPADLPVEEFSVESESGTTVSGWCIKNDDSNSVVILVHPLHCTRQTMLGRARLLFQNGFSVVLIDLQAHGNSPGDKITLGHLEKHDVSAAVSYSKDTFPNCKLGIVGWSLGGASALLASPLGVDAIVLESVFPTISHAVYGRVEMRLGFAKHVAAPLLLCQLPIRLGIAIDDIRPIDFIDQVGCPVMILGGDADLHTPIDQTKMLFDAANEPKQFITFKGAAHEDLHRFDTELYVENVVGFLKENL